jgi:hypothetical protein
VVFAACEHECKNQLLLCILRAAMNHRFDQLAIVAVFACAALCFAAPARADRSTLGPHFGVNFDFDDAFIGLEGRFDVADVGSSAVLQINPSFSYYFTDNVDVFNFSLNFPFEFQINDSVLRPMAAPGIGLWHFSNGSSETEVVLNLIGGLLFYLDGVEPFVQLRVYLGDGSGAELMGGVLFRL